MVGHAACCVRKEMCIEYTTLKTWSHMGRCNELALLESACEHVDWTQLAQIVFNSTLHGRQPSWLFVIGVSLKLPLLIPRVQRVFCAVI
jgi:hypothetical protein